MCIVSSATKPSGSAFFFTVGRHDRHLVAFSIAGDSSYIFLATACTRDFIPSLNRIVSSFPPAFVRAFKTAVVSVPPLARAHSSIPPTTTPRSPVPRARPGRSNHFIVVVARRLDASTRDARARGARIRILSHRSPNGRLSPRSRRIASHRIAHRSTVARSATRA